MRTQRKNLSIIKQIDIFHGGCTPHIIQMYKMMFGPAKKRKIVNPKKTKFPKIIQNWLEVGLHVSCRAENLHAEIFFHVLWGLE